MHGIIGKIMIFLLCFSIATAILFGPSAAAVESSQLKLAKKYLPTLQFDGKDFFDKGEKNFPVSFTFDGDRNLENNNENYILRTINENQAPIVYVKFVKDEVNDILYVEYWYYYAFNDWINNHEHDWEWVFVTVQDGTPVELWYSGHGGTDKASWDDVRTDNGHPFLGVDGGSHAFKLGTEDGVKIRYNGDISANNGIVSYSSSNIKWTINTSDYTGNDKFSKFYYGEGSEELQDCRLAPWYREQWDDPNEALGSPSDHCPVLDITVFNETSNYLAANIYLDSQLIAKKQYFVSIYTVPGDHVIVASKKGYSDSSTILSVQTDTSVSLIMSR